MDVGSMGLRGVAGLRSSIDQSCRGPTKDRFRRWQLAGIERHARPRLRCSVMRRASRAVGRFAGNTFCRRRREIDRRRNRVSAMICRMALRFTIDIVAGSDWAQSQLGWVRSRTPLGRRPGRRHERRIAGGARCSQRSVPDTARPNAG